MSELTQSDSIRDTISDLRAAVLRRHTHSMQWRESQLNAMLSMLEAHHDDFVAALQSDLGRSEFETNLTEINATRQVLHETLAALPVYAAPDYVSMPASVFPASGKIVREPLGLILIISPWNFPINLALMPLIGAIASGNAVLLKPSEVSSNTSKILAKAIGEFLDPCAIRVVEGGEAEVTEILTHRFDHIFFTGSTNVGRIIYQAAAKHLTPVTLELGGKSPVLILDKSVNLRVAARRILWGKHMNCGQICIAPDYCVVVEELKSEFYKVIKEVYSEMFPAPLQDSKEYARIINNTHTARLASFLEESDEVELKKRGEILVGGEIDFENKFIAPTVFQNTSSDAKIMQEEIFGPLLPVVEVGTAEEALGFVNERPKPLVLYLFSNDQRIIDQVTEQTSTGAVSINEVIMHVGVSNLPFGGVGDSGIGAYHGKVGFDTFSHLKPVLHQSSRNMLDADFRYPPYNDNKKWWWSKLLP